MRSDDGDADDGWGPCKRGHGSGSIVPGCSPLAGPVPGFEKLYLMKRPPLADEICLSPRKRTRECLTGRDVHDSLGFAVPRMEVRYAMIPAVDVDDDAVEGGDPGHRANIPTACDIARTRDE